MNELQRKLLVIIEYFDDLCKDNGITYYLMGGSALGCARHKGFIPWDDDIDVFVSYDDYNKLLLLRDKIDSDGFCFQPIRSEGNNLYNAKLRLKGTFIAEENKRINANACNGIFIDVMILFDAPSNIFSKARLFFAAKLLAANALSTSGYKTLSKLKNMFIRYSSRRIQKRGENYYFSKITKYNHCKTKYVCHVFGRAPFSKSFYEKKWFHVPQKMMFENVLLNMPTEYDKYLKCRYGKRYMDMPSQKTIDSYPKHAAYINLDSEEDSRK